MNCQTTQDLLNGYADTELDLVNHLAVEEHLRSCPACERVNSNQMSLKSAMTDESLYFQAPTALRMNIQKAVREADRESAPAGWSWLWRLVPIVAAATAVVILAIFLLRPGLPKDDLLAKEVVSGHVRSMMANHLTDVVSTDQHTVKPWFDGKLDFSPRVIDLAASGFPLTGGRMDYIGSRPVAALVYQRRQHVINLFVFPSGGDPDIANQMSERQGYNLIHWNKSGMSFWAVSDVNLNELQEFAQGIQN